MKRARTLIIIAIIIMVIIVLSSVAAIWWSNYQTSKNAQTGNSSSNQSVPSQSQEQPAEKTADNADQIAYNGNVQGGISELNNAIKNTADKNELFIYYSRMATLQLNNNMLSDALASAKQAYQINQISESGALVAQIAEQMGDKATAIQYYQNAIDHIDSSDVYAKSDKDYYTSKLTQLRGTQ